MDLKVIFFQVAKAVFILLLVVVMALSLAPVSQPDFSPNDKINHFLAYSVLAFIGLISFQRWYWVVAGLFCYGILIEFLQGMTAYRYASIADVGANSFGILIGLAFFSVLYATVLKTSRLYRN